ncbi:HD domain-containing protein [Pseudomonas luteola]
MRFPIENLRELVFEAYLVGGSVRDMALKREPKDIDIVVVNETPKSMIELGARQIAKSFPIFLFDGMKAEFALACKDRPEAFVPGQYVSLEEDLFRRDLTINAMAINRDGVLIDPYGGMNDIRQGKLRHVSKYFSVDPLRIFRVARFAAQLDFTVAQETMDLMKNMVKSNLVELVDPNRLTKEMTAAMLSSKPHRFFEVLEETGALARWLPELSTMKGIPQRSDYHAEGCVWTHNMMVLNEASLYSEGLSPQSKLRIRTAALFHDIGKTKTPAEYLYDKDGKEIGKHLGHESPKLMNTMFSSLSERLIGFPSDVLTFAKLVAVIHQKVHRINEMSPKGLVKLFHEAGGKKALQQESFLDDLEIACRADHMGRLIKLPNGAIQAPVTYPEGERFKRMMMIVASVKEGPIFQEAIADGYSIEVAKDRVHRERLRVLTQHNFPNAMRSTDAMMALGTQAR